MKNKKLMAICQNSIYFVKSYIKMNGGKIHGPKTLSSRASSFTALSSACTWRKEHRHVPTRLSKICAHFTLCGHLHVWVACLWRWPFNRGLNVCKKSLHKKISKKKSTPCRDGPMHEYTDWLTKYKNKNRAVGTGPVCPAMAGPLFVHLMNNY